MASIREKVVNDEYNRAYALINNDDMHIRFKEIKEFVNNDENLTKEEKVAVIKRFDNDYDYFKVIKNDGVKRDCENCKGKCLATLYCEVCVRKYLQSKFSTWTSGNEIIDSLIQKCQKESLIPYMIVEWIPYDRLKNIKFSVKGGYSEVYTAEWEDGCYKEWDLEEKKLKRSGTSKVALKRLETIENDNKTWLEEALYISNKWGSIVQCYGLTKNPSDDKFMLVMNYTDTDLRRYLQENRNQITLKTKIKIIFEIVKALTRVHEENSVHKNLHSGNVLYLESKNDWYISDVGFYGPADKPSNSVYGNLCYMAPEVIYNSEYSFKSDIYSVAILIWEVLSEQAPFFDHKNDQDLALNIVNGTRPKILPGTPSIFKELMEECWDANPEKRPEVHTLWEKVEDINKSIHENNDSWKDIYLNQEMPPKKNSKKSKLK
ncbi:kinase-like domain-containing protein [Rhizophagus clarus]|uniref:Kinase-like domain-containing protein n=1 Tax=Rhizophagus clarus TaxID=94130 RepID=A0A8H3R435_9GLOM|nr:kinase-like domain-containing protein [Rhizophagus clarus]